ncbi:MAG: amidohydrolase [Firmicutes bacterium]|nr:amidohydrolase [Bacillota bacterium]
MSILIKNVNVLTMETENGQLKAPFTADIVVEDGRITLIGSAPEAEYDEVLDGSHRLAMPGLINAHGHAGMSLMRGFGDDMELMSWLHDRIFPTEERLVENDVLLGGRLAVLEMIKTGTTAFADMYFFCDKLAQAVEEGGIRASISQGMNFSPAERIQTAFALNYKPTTDRITMMFGPHAPYTCSEEFLTAQAEVARESGIPIHIHLCETQDEERQIKEKYGCTPVEFLRRCDFFRGNKVLAAHGVWLHDEDIEYLKDYDFSVASNPVSNLKLASGIAPVKKLLDAGINVAVGTDSVCSNNNIDMFEELRTACLVAKVRDLDPLAVPAGTALQLATVNGAKALALSELGVLREGAKADIILIDTDQPHFFPRHDMISHLVYAASGKDVASVICDGKIIMRDRQVLTLDEERVMYEANEAAMRLCYSK